MSDVIILDHLKEPTEEQFKKFIIGECRRMDRLDVYEWVADDELKIKQLQQENQQLKAENYRLEHNEKVLLQREGRAINYIDQVIMYKPCAREISEELNTLIGILGGGNNE